MLFFGPVRTDMCCFGNSVATVLQRAAAAAAACQYTWMQLCLQYRKAAVADHHMLLTYGLALEEHSWQWRLVPVFGIW
jgi:hypothetical protein